MTGQKQEGTNASKTQKTPKGYEIPVPKRSEVLGDLKKLAKGSATRRPSK